VGRRDKKYNGTGYWSKLHTGRGFSSGPLLTGMSLTDAHAARIRAENEKRQARQENRKQAKHDKTVDKRVQHFKCAAEKIKEIKARQAKRRVDSDGYPIYHAGMTGTLFYKTREWKKLRYTAIEKHGRTCACCGAHGGMIHVDHIKPRSKWPELELVLDNLQVLCEDCNIGKGADFHTDWRKPEG
jgi:HNH endonuclease